MKRMLLVGLAIFIMGSGLFLLISPRLLLLVRFVQGLGAAALSTVSITLVARYFSARRGAFGIYNTIKGAGYVIAPATGAFFTHRYGSTMIFVASAAVALLAILLSLFLLPGDRGARNGVNDSDDDITLVQFLQIFRDPRLLPVYAVIVINMFLVSILFGFLPVYLHGLGYSVLESGIVLSIATAAYLLIQPIAGVLADRIDIRMTVIVGLGLAALMIIGMTFTSGAVLMVVVILAGIGIGTVWTNSDALVGALAEMTKLGSSVGAAQSFKEFGDMVGPLVVGALTQFYGVRVGFVACGSIGLLLVATLTRSRALRQTSRRSGPWRFLKVDGVRQQFHFAPSTRTAIRRQMSC
jgi:MFS transporter, ACDE family, multidrug resistance protein